MALGADALWSLTVIAVVVGPPSLLVAVAVWLARRVGPTRSWRSAGVVGRPASRVARRP